MDDIIVSDKVIICYKKYLSSYSRSKSLSYEASINDVVNKISLVINSHDVHELTKFKYLRDIYYDSLSIIDITRYLKSAYHCISYELYVLNKHLKRFTHFLSPFITNQIIYITQRDGYYSIF